MVSPDICGLTLTCRASRNRQLASGHIIPQMRQHFVQIAFVSKLAMSSSFKSVPSETDVNYKDVLLQDATNKTTHIPC